jgi:hypothetical protein
MSCWNCILQRVCNPDEKLLKFDGKICNDFIEIENDNYLEEEDFWYEMSYNFFNDKWGDNPCDTENDYYDDLIEAFPDPNENVEYMLNEDYYDTDTDVES